MFSKVVSNIRKRAKRSKTKESKLTASKSSPSFKLRPAKQRDEASASTSDWYTTNDEESEADEVLLVQSKSMTITPIKHDRVQALVQKRSPPSHPSSLPANRKFPEETLSNSSSNTNSLSFNFGFVDDDTDDADDEGMASNFQSPNFKTMKLNRKSMKNENQERWFFKIAFVCLWWNLLIFFLPFC
jgi:hypothetical protein